MADAQTEFGGEILVSSTIIDYLSSGLYKSPAACLKELVNNSYDADATIVEIFVKPDADRIIIADDGQGISKDEFVSHFKKISTSSKRVDGETTKRFKRPKIGKIGIGFIAANEICEFIEIYSTKTGSQDLLYVAIDFEALKNPPEVRTRDGEHLTKADYEGTVTRDADVAEHYTHLFLSNVKGAAREILVSAKRNSNVDKEVPAYTLYGETREGVNEVLRSGIKNWQEFDAYSETMLKVALNVPVKYHDNWMPPKHRKNLREFEEHVAELNFSVRYDGIELRKPIVFSADKKTLVHKFSISGETVSFKGYFYAQHGTIRPTELQGLLVRIRDSAVGGFDHTFLEFSQSEYSLIQKWLSCEVYVNDALEEAMNIDRTTLRDVHPVFVEFRKLLHVELRKMLNRARKEIYQEQSNIKRTKQAQEAVDQLATIANESLEGAVRQRVAKEIRPLKRNDIRENERQVLRKYTVVELFSLVIDVTKEVLPKRYQEKFLSVIIRRLRKGTD